MPPLKLDKRLSTVAEEVRGEAVFDVGTDHAYLPVYLVESGICSTACASDINEGPLERARQTVLSHGLENSIRLFLCDGTEGAPLDGVTDVICAGMGGELISRIVLSDERLKGKRLILQPMTKAPYLRQSLDANGFSLLSEKGVAVGRHIYTVMVWEYTGEPAVGGLFRHTGKLSVEREGDRAYLEAYLSSLEKELEGKRHSEPQKAFALGYLVRELRKYIDVNKNQAANSEYL